MADRPTGRPEPSGAEIDVFSEDRATIARLAEEIVPALSAAIAADGLAEVEVRRPGWRVRVRRAASAVAAAAAAEGSGGRRRSQDRPERADRDRSAHVDATAHHDRTNGSGATSHSARSPRRDADPPEDRFRVVATSPSVGPFRADRELRRGARVREGDRLGTVDLLGVPQEVASPADGIVMAILVEPDQAVEYGQPLVELERASSTAGSAPPGAGQG
ncbi:MAG TPA: biotin/lipoyl-containing protein [Candidatus Limnocylindrales bacterium]|nr:biotin/lipoyl-containing protein [Candidatus Limnocylindrales bacterium]